MHIDVIDFGTYKKHDVKKIRLNNDNAVSISVLTMGAILNEFLVPDGDKPKNIVLGFDNISEYYQNPFYVGMSIGRTAGRIKNGKIPLTPLGEETITLPQNEGTKNHQGGPNGFYSYLWNYRLHTDKDFLSVTLYRTIHSSEDGFPGDINVSITFKLTNDNELSITYTGISTADTLFNPTAHIYFNLNGQDNDILNHKLTLASDSYLEVDTDKVPTGKLIPVANTPFDFRKPRTLKNTVQELSDTSEKGLDDIFKLRNLKGEKVKLENPGTHDSIQLFSARNGLVMYTANTFDSSMKFSHQSGHPYMGIALEAQTLSDTHNHPNFGDISLTANAEKTYEIRYQYSRN